MAIDLKQEKLVSMTEAATYAPRRREGRPVSPGSIWRWIVKGHRGVKLEGARTPAGWCTSVEAMGRFFSSLASIDTNDAPLPSPSARSRLEQIHG